MNRMVYSTDALGVQGRGPAMEWSRFHVIPAEGAAVRANDEAQGKRPGAVARFEKLCRDALLNAKMDRATELLARVMASRSRPIPDAEGAGPSAAELADMNRYHPSPWEMDAQRAAAQDQARICREAEASYAARNPHKARENSALAGYPANPAEPVSAKKERPAADADSTFEARCRASESAYAARNPHKMKEVQA